MYVHLKMRNSMSRRINKADFGFGGVLCEEVCLMANTKW